MGDISSFHHRVLPPLLTVPAGQESGRKADSSSAWWVRRAPGKVQSVDCHIASVCLLVSPIYFRSLIVPGTRYPIAYWIQVLPLSIVRQIEFKQLATYGEIRTNAGWTFLVGTLLGLTGVIDAILYRFTRSSIFAPRQQVEPEAPDLPANRGKESETPVNPSSTAV
jgi:hypothetical protein